MFEHIDRHANEITFVKYQYRSFCEEWKSPRLKYFLSKFGLKLFAPSTTVTLRHYDTFLQSRLKKESVYGGSGQPSCETNYLGLCNFCPSYRFKSKSGKNCHMSVFHHRQNAQPNPKKFIYDICHTNYSSLSSLNRHKKEKTPKEIKEKNGKHWMKTNFWMKTLNEMFFVLSKKNKTKPWTINEMLRATKTVNQNIKNEQEDDACSARNFIINEIDGAEIYWEECGRWSSWFPVYYVTKDGHVCEICI